MRSERAQHAARENGKLGGRPPKVRPWDYPRHDDEPVASRAADGDVLSGEALSGGALPNPHLFDELARRSTPSLGAVTESEALVAAGWHRSPLPGGWARRVCIPVSEDDEVGRVVYDFDPLEW